MVEVLRAFKHFSEHGFRYTFWGGGVAATRWFHGACSWKVGGLGRHSAQSPLSISLLSSILQGVPWALCPPGSTPALIPSQEDEACSHVLLQPLMLLFSTALTVSYYNPLFSCLLLQLELGVVGRQTLCLPKLFAYKHL